MKNRSLCTRTLSGLLLAMFTLALASCGHNYYKFPQYTFANRPIPPSKLANRVMVGVTANGTQGGLSILDGLRDIRSNIQNTITSFSISGYSGGYPSKIINYPAETAGYVYSQSDGSVAIINYGTEASTGSAGTLPALSTGLAIPPSRAAVYSAEESTGQLVALDNSTGKSYALNLPNVYRVASNTGNTVVLAMVRNSNTLYRLVKLNANQATPPGYVDCQPYNLPVYCVVPVVGTYDRPQDAYFSLDGTTVDVLNCGPECGGSTASVSILNLAPLVINTIPTTSPDTNAVVSNFAVPGGVTTAISDGTTLYLAGQQLMADGLFAGNLTTVSLANLSITGKYSISDGNHSKLLFADDNTLWIGSQFCATGERAKNNLNYNCLTRFDLGAKTASIVPAVDPTSSTSSVPYPNTDGNTKYYGSLTGLCWVETFHKVYTAYGGQVHAFNTADASEINNQFIIVQGTALDVAYMDASTDETN
ncbi:hypothetical protein [Granulicella sibirica]|uniref:Lipoprotein n=1 Tax=Granulicella sibirica TaxID=2479048 RepID=A0A4Q0T2C0_9BACT|nr:hypothetical protein [Granulicella sibirica]RXH56982.1 hypothetical protein GRAN_0292 [Granulicella sibirica]